MKSRNMKNGIFVYPDAWRELNGSQASTCTDVILCANTDTVAVYYATIACQYLTDQQTRQIVDIAHAQGLSSCNLYGIIDDDLIKQLGIANVGNARLITIGG